MKYYGSLLLILFTLLTGVAHSQPIVINANVTRGCETLSVDFSYTYSSPVTSVRWDFGDNTPPGYLLSPTHVYSKPGKYSVKLAINNTDSTTVADMIIISAKPRAGIEFRDTVTGSPLDVVLQGVVYNADSVFFDPFQYSWTIEGVAAGNTSIIEHQFDTTGYYNAQLIVLNTENCGDTVNMVLPIIEKLYVPNVFTPNNDDKNDIFEVSSYDRYFLNFQLFSRYGLLVYKTKAKTISWDGKMPSGEDVPAGIYYYIIEAENSKPKISEKGFLYIYR